MKKQISRILALLLVVSMLLVTATACGSSSSSSSGSTGGSTSASGSETSNEDSQDVSTGRTTTADTGERYPSVTVALSYFPASSSPMSDPVDGFLTFNLVYQSLFQLSEDGDDYVGVLAKSYEIVDETHYRVYLYDYIYDSEGNHLTADDVVFCYENVIASGTARGFDLFESIEAEDEFTVMFTWTEEPVEVQALASLWTGTRIYTEAAYTSSSDEMATQPIGTGPYVCTEFLADSSITLEARDDYWQTDESVILDTAKANVQTFNVVLIAEAAQNVMALANGSIDVSLNIPYDNLADFEDGGKYADGYVLEEYDGTTNALLAVNQSSGSVGDDINFRLAVFYAIDNEAVASVAGDGRIASATFGCPAFPDYPSALESEENYMTTCDLELAQEYLDASNYNGETLTLLCRSDEALSNMAVAIQAMLQQIGISTKIEALDDSLLNSELVDEDAWDLYIALYGGSTCAGAFNRYFNRDEWSNGMALGFIDDDTLQERYETFATAATHNDDTAKEFIDYIVENAYSCALCYTTTYVVYTNDIVSAPEFQDVFCLLNAAEYYLD